MTTKFFTNEGENTLLNKFTGVFEHNQDIEFFDALVGYFRASGYFSVRPYLDNVPHIRILVGINVDEIVAKYQSKGLLFKGDTQQTVAVLTYRTPHNREGALLDANQAISICRQQAREWNINPEQIGMIGFSAGAHLTAAAAQNPPRQNFSILVYPAYLNQADSTRLTTDIAITKETPPAFITQAQDDKRYYRSALAYSLALEQANIPFELHFYTRGGHGYGLRDLGKPAHQWTTPCEAWLRDQQILPTE